MPSKSQAQAAFMQMSRTSKGRAALRKSGKRPAPASVGNEFSEADKGRKIGALPKHVGKK